MSRDLVRSRFPITMSKCFNHIFNEIHDMEKTAVRCSSPIETKGLHPGSFHFTSVTFNGFMFLFITLFGISCYVRLIAFIAQTDLGHSWSREIPQHHESVLS